MLSPAEPWAQHNESDTMVADLVDGHRCVYDCPELTQPGKVHCAPCLCLWGPSVKVENGNCYSASRASGWGFSLAAVCTPAKADVTPLKP